MGAKKQKLLAQYTEQASCENSEGGLFSGVAIFVNGWTRPSSDELKRIMMSHGGVYHHYESQATTHIIASNLPDVKVRALRGDEMIVRPEWIVESVKVRAVNEDSRRFHIARRRCFNIESIKTLCYDLSRHAGFDCLLSIVS